MSISDEIAQLEARIEKAKIPLAKVLSGAGVDRSTWSRWRSDDVSPTLTKWRAVLRVIDELTGTVNAASAPASDDTGDHGAVSFPDPIPEKSESPAPVRGADDRAVAPADIGR